MTRSRVGLALVYFFFSLFTFPPLLISAALLRYWLLTHLRQSIYVEYPYLAVGLVFLSLGLLEVFCVIRGVGRAGSWRLLLGVPVILCLAAMINFPNIAPEDFEGLRHLGTVFQDLNSFGKDHGRFPSTVVELEQSSPTVIATSRYRRSGETLHHRVVLLGNASGPYSGSVGDEPGVLFYAVTGDYKQVWLTETQLDRPAGGRVQFVRILSPDGFTTSYHLQVMPRYSAK